METDDDGTSSIHFNKLPRKIYVSRSFPDRPEVAKMRYVSQVIDQKEGLAFATIHDQVVLQTTPKGRVEVRATVVEDDRRVKSLLIQKFDIPGGPSKKQYFNLQPPTIGKLIALLETIKTMPLETGEKLHLSAAEAGSTVLNRDTAQRIFSLNEELFLEIARDSNLKSDLVALGYRRKALTTFERMLAEPGFFAAEEKRTGLASEKLWQSFFEANTWIFGYGLAYQFLGKLDEGKLERTIVGSDLGSRGKRADAIMKTQARINSVCFVEIKRHDENLLHTTQYRGDAWIPAKELIGGVAQVHATVQGAIERYTPRLNLTDNDGNPTGEPVFNIDPRAFLIIGNLQEFATEHGLNVSKFRAFESFRRNIRRPEILTFDELLNRARFIVQHQPSVLKGDDGDIDDNVPF